MKNRHKNPWSLKLYKTNFHKSITNEKKTGCFWHSDLYNQTFYLLFISYPSLALVNSAQLYCVIYSPR